MKESFEENKNYYEILEVDIQSTQEDIQQAYQRAKNAYTGTSLALYSLMTPEECKEVLQIIDQAYTVLGDPVRRSEYDKVKGFIKDPKEHKNTNELNREGIGKDVKGDSLESLANQISSKNLDRDFKISSKEADVSKVTALSRYKLDFKVDDVIEEEIDQCEEFTGDFLRKIREYKGVDVFRMAEMTRISKTHIKNLEDENIENLPAEVYVRGFVYQYAKVLKLNPDIVANSYLKRFREKKKA